MIKANGYNKLTGQRFIQIGLSFDELRRLMAGDSITTSGKGLTFDGRVVIVAGRDDPTMIDIFKRENPTITMEIE